MAFVSPSSSLLPSSSLQQQQPCDDIWKKFDDFLLTPPQSPPVLKFEQSYHESDTMEGIDMQDILGEDVASCLDDLDLSAALDNFLEDASNCFSETSLAEVLNVFSTSPSEDVLHDCMWSSGYGINDKTRFMNNRSTNSLLRPSSTEVSNLSSSPLLPSFCSEMLSCEDHLVSGDSGTSSMADDDEVPMLDSEDDEESNVFVSSGSDYLIDHSYGSTMPKNVKTYASSSCNRKSSSASSCHSLLVGPSRSDRKKSKKLAREQQQEIMTPVSVKFVKRKRSSPSALDSKSTSKALKRKQPAKQCMSAKKKTVSSPLTSSSSATCFTVTLSSAWKNNASSKISLSSPVTVSSVAASIVKNDNSFDSSSSCSSMTSASASKHASPSKKSKRINSSSSTSSDVSMKTSAVFPEKEKRREHNDSEKKRRDHLRNAFHSLRDEVPKLMNDANRKPARIVILYEANSYLNELEEEAARLAKTMKTELAKKANLQKRLAQLQAL